MSKKEHPVWSVYDQYRTVRLNVKYYSYILSKYEKLNFALELILMISAPSASIAGLWFWDTQVGEIIWKLMGVLAAFTAVIKPLLGFAKKIKKMEEVIAGYKILGVELEEISEKVKQRKKYDRELQVQFENALRRKGFISLKEGTEEVRHSLRQKCAEEVDEELPAQHFYIPES